MRIIISCQYRLARSTEVRLGGLALVSQSVSSHESRPESGAVSTVGIEVPESFCARSHGKKWVATGEQCLDVTKNCLGYYTTADQRHRLQTRTTGTTTRTALVKRSKRVIHANPRLPVDCGSLLGCVSVL